MWRTYSDISDTWFKNATKIIDKYHWIRQAIWAFENIRKIEQKKLSNLAEKEEQLTARLNGEDKELFQNYVSAYIEFSTTSNADSFILGFRLGAKFTYDTFVTD